MSITYPIDFPTSFGVSNFTIDLVSAIAVSESPFTYATQTQEHQGSAWVISGEINLLDRDQAEEYNAWLLKLNGRLGTFLMTIPGSEQPRGVATGSPLVNGSGQTGKSLIIDGFTPNTTNILKVGDFIQLGSGLSTTLHKVLNSVNSDASGQVIVDIQPKIITAPNDNDPVVVTNCKGHFRLTSNSNPITISSPNVHSLSFNAKEVR